MRSSLVEYTFGHTGHWYVVVLGWLREPIGGAMLDVDSVGVAAVLLVVVAETRVEARGLNAYASWRSL